MPDRENVIHSLECCFDVQSGWKDAVWVCPACLYAKNNGQPCETLAPLLDDAIVLLKAQRPRVMALEEIQDGECYWFEAGKDLIIVPVICVRYEEDARKRYICFTWQFGTFSWEVDDYDKTWRCWTARPTEEQRKMTPWQS